MQDSDETDRGTEILLVSSECLESFSRRFKEEIINKDRINEGKSVQFRRKSKDDMEVRDIQSVELLLHGPDLLFNSLASGTAGIFARVIVDHLMTAVITLVNMKSVFLGAAGTDIIKNLVLFAVQLRRIDLLKISEISEYGLNGGSHY